MLSRHGPEPPVGEDLVQVPEIHVGLAVALPRERQDRVGTHLHAAVDRRGEVHSQEWEPGVGHGIDESLDQGLPVLREAVVLAPERHDPDRFLHAVPDAGGEPRGHGRHPVHEQSGAVDEGAGLHRVQGGLQHEPPGRPGDAGQLAGRPDDASQGAELPRVRAGHLPEVDDPGERGVEGAQAGAVGLDLPQLLGSDHADPFDAVGPGPSVQLLQARDLLRAGGDDDLAAEVVADALLVAELQQRLLPGHARLRFHRPRPVVDAGVEHAAVVAGLVRAELRLLLQQGAPQPGMLLAQAHGRGQPDDAAADDRQIERFHEKTGKGRGRPRCRRRHCPGASLVPPGQ